MQGLIPSGVLVLSRFSRFLPLSKDIHVRLISSSERSTGVSVSVAHCVPIVVTVVY